MQHSEISHVFRHNYNYDLLDDLINEKNMGGVGTSWNMGDHLCLILAFPCESAMAKLPCHVKTA